MDFNGSTYPVAKQPDNPLDTVAKVQGIQKNDLAISGEKLRQYNEKYNVVERGLGNLVNEPDLNFDHFANTFQKFVNQGVMTPDQAASELSRMPTIAGIKRQNPNATPDQLEKIYNQNLRKAAEVHLLNAQETHNAIQHYTGQNATVDTGNQLVPGVQGGLRATGQGMAPAPFSQTGASFPKQLPVGTSGFDAQGNPIFQGPATSPPISIPPAGRGNRLPVTQPPLQGANGRGEPLIGEPATPKERVAQGQNSAAGIAPGPPVLFQEGKKAYDEDITHATQKLGQIKPAQEALKLMDPDVIKGLTGTGPIAEKASKVLSALKGVGIISTGENDPVAQRQELVKKLARYLSDNPAGQRSDEAQKLVQKANADPDYHLLPALVNLTRDNIALDRVESARSLAFEGKDFSKYLTHRAGFPNAIDQRAFKLDLMPTKERDQLIDSILHSKDKFEKSKFVESMKLAQKLNMYNP